MSLDPKHRTLYGATLDHEGDNLTHLPEGEIVAVTRAHYDPDIPIVMVLAGRDAKKVARHFYVTVGPLPVDTVKMQPTRFIGHIQGDGRRPLFVFESEVKGGK